MSDPGRRIRTTRLIAVAVAATTLSCGTRVAHQAGSAAGPRLSQPSSLTMSPSPGALGAASVSSGPGTPAEEHREAVSVAAPAQPRASGSPIGGTAPPKPAAPSAAGTAPAAPTGAALAGGPDGGQPPPGNPGGPLPTPAPPIGSSPVILASVGTLSGPAGSTFVPMLQGAQVWVKSVNGRGGLSGHPVRLITYDDGADPSRHRAQVQEAVEREGVIAFLMNTEFLTGEGSVAYIDAKRVPVVGVTGGEDWPFSSPMYFPQMTGGPGNRASLAALTGTYLVPQGKESVGTLVCTEAPGCAAVERSIDRYAKAFGYRHVYRGRASLAQPDFTAECLTARNAGVEVLVVVMDASSIRRIGNSCARQSFRSIIMQPGQGLADSMKEDPNLDGMVVPSPVFPYFQAGTPALDEYQAAMRTYGSRVAPSAGPATGWTAGKLFEKAAARLPEPPTREAVLAGLWSIRNDTLGGLTMPLTFVEGRPPTPAACWFTLTIAHGAWTSPDGGTMHCHDIPD